MKNLLILYPHGLGDCILLTPALREFYNITGNKASVATLERFKTAEFFKHNPYVEKTYFTKDAWSDYANSNIGFEALYNEWKTFAKQNSFTGFIMPMHAAPLSKIKINLRTLGLHHIKNYSAEIYTSSEDEAQASNVIANLVGNKSFGFVQTHTGVKSKDLPEDYGRKWLLKNKGLEHYIEVGKHFDPLEYNINIQFEIMRRAAAVCIPDSVFYHACHAMGKNIDLVYFGRGHQVYERVKHIQRSQENVIYKI
jgi:hypothetical protein